MFTNLLDMYTANILLVKKATFPCLFFPYFFNVLKAVKIM